MQRPFSRQSILVCCRRETSMWTQSKPAGLRQPVLTFLLSRGGWLVPLGSLDGFADQLEHAFAHLQSANGATGDRLGGDVDFVRARFGIGHSICSCLQLW